jgi:uncharacterized protein YndB with AHSA1/START domain
MAEAVLTEERGRLRIQRIIDAPRELVWKAWTDPETISRWWGRRALRRRSLRSNSAKGAVPF